jgi:quercetin dioxygenase-like cupin family protein
MKPKAKSNQTRDPNSLGLISVNLTDEVAKLKQLPRWASEDRHAASLVKMGSLNVLLLTLKRDAELTEHRTHGPISVYVLAGLIRFSAGKEQLTLSAGSMVALERDAAHSVRALEESSILVTTSIA